MRRLNLTKSRMAPMKTTLVIAVLVVCLGTRASAQTIEYNITDLGILANAPSNGGSYPTAMNNLGQVVGYGDTYTLYSHAFLYTGSGPLVNLGSLGGDSSVSVATGINDQSVVVGYTGTPTSSAQAFIYTQSGGMQNLETLSGSTSVYSEALAINNSSQIVGNFETASGGEDGFIYSGSGAMVDLGPYLPQRINNAGLVAAVLLSGTQCRSYVSSDGTGTWVNIGSLGGSYTVPKGMNDSGEIVGYSATTTAYEQGRPFVYSGGTMTDLGTFGGEFGLAFGINDSGFVVGSADFPGDETGAAFVYFGSGTIENLNDLVNPSLGWNIGGALAINDSGQIMAEGYQPGGNYHALLLTPVPEPFTLCLLIVVSCGYFRFSRLLQLNSRSGHRSRASFSVTTGEIT